MMDLQDVVDGRVGVSYDVHTGPGILATTITRFARVDKLTADDRGLCIVVTYDDGETETVHVGRITYVDGRHL